MKYYARQAIFFRLTGENAGDRRNHGRSQNPVFRQYSEKK
jgi:hypothetical protein